MSRTGPDKPDLDALLRAALGGDPTQPVEQRLRASLRPGWHRAQAETPARLQWAWLRLPSWPLPARRAALAALAAAMILGGAGWNLAHVPQAAASSLSAVMAARAVARAASSVSAMTCTVELRGAEGPSTTAVVEWRATTGTVIRVADGPPRVIPAAGGNGPETVLSQLGGTAREQAPAHELPVPALGDFLSPARVAATLDGTWSAVAAQPGASGGDYRVERSRGLPIAVSLDPASGLPRLLRTPEVAAKCDWTPGPPEATLVARPSIAAFDHGGPSS
ncbi:MAG: hypothetical protein AB2L07_00380 [Thermoanaerobaculaceae bacterium]